MEADLLRRDLEQLGMLGEASDIASSVPSLAAEEPLTDSPPPLKSCGGLRSLKCKQQRRSGWLTCGRCLASCAMEHAVPACAAVPIKIH